ncbi:MAG: HigA family addiction module antidote protein [Gammaproteobacteria bacterium]|nr:HigA family addiction module antidote protein [Gammaproteobacteria bacterium]
MRMHDPAHPGEIARDNLEAEGWTVNECAARLGVSRITLSRLLNGRAGVSAAMALALERIGWGTADHWVRMQGSYDLAQERRRQAAA